MSYSKGGKSRPGTAFQPRPVQVQIDQYEGDTKQLKQLEDKLNAKLKESQELSNFEVYLKTRLEAEKNRIETLRLSQTTSDGFSSGNFKIGGEKTGGFFSSIKSNTIDVNEYNKRQSAATQQAIQNKQTVFEDVQRDLQQHKEGLLLVSPHSSLQGSHWERSYTTSLGLQDSQKKVIPLGYYDKSKSIKAIDLKNLKSQIHSCLSAGFITENQEKQLINYRQQYNLGHYYDEWMKDKKSRLTSQIQAYVNTISKLDPDERALEHHFLQDKHFLSLDKRQHVKRIQSAKNGTSKQAQETQAQLTESKTKNPPQKRIKPITAHGIDHIKQEQQNNKQETPSKSSKKPEHHHKTQQMQRNSTAVPVPVPTNWQTFIRQKSTSRGSYSSTHSEQKSGVQVLEQKSDITLFENFDYASPFPKWLLQTKKYDSLKHSEKYDMDQKIIAVSKKESFNRSEYERHIVALFLSKISLFKMMPFHMLEVIATQLTYLFVDQGDYICKQGDKGDCMYVIFTGQVEIIINGFLIKKVFCGGELVGRTALETDKPRNADMRAKLPCNLLVLSRIDYQQCLNRALLFEKGNIAAFINSHPFFKHFRPDKIERMCEEIKARFLAPKECLYKESDLIDNFYIVKNGHLIKTIQVELEKSNQWPGKDENGNIFWEKHTQAKNVTYTIDFKASDIVGYFDIISGNEAEVRTETIDSVSDTFVLFINKNIFKLIFEEDDMLLFKEYHRKKYPSNQANLIKKVKKEEEHMKANINALESAMALHLKSCEQVDLESSNKRLNRYIKANKNKQRDEMNKKLPFELKPPKVIVSKQPL